MIMEGQVTRMPHNDSGKVSIGKIQKDDLAFRMNAASRKVLQKVLMGFIIMKPDVRRSRVNEGSGRRCPGMKRVLGRSGFLLRCHRATNERKREKKKHVEKHQQDQYHDIEN